MTLQTLSFAVDKVRHVLNKSELKYLNLIYY